MNAVLHNICLIDDDKIYQFTARKMLESTRLTKDIKSFYDGSEAIAYFRDENNKDSDALPDVIFLDINMPVMNGWEFLEAFQELHKNFPKPIQLYVVSSSVDDSDIQRSRQYETVKDYIIKPINRIKYEELLQTTLAS